MTRHVACARVGRALCISPYHTSHCTLTLILTQGLKFVKRFDPVTYVKITEQMDAHDVGHQRGE